ncbi:hypothetical protein BSKO_07136 [Bryopsis sp. KO-2023]|nr:hypothetical protein BSKO_07136 [Bryopsis sp. KO-2023]
MHKLAAAAAELAAAAKHLIPKDPVAKTDQTLGTFARAAEELAASATSMAASHAAQSRVGSHECNISPFKPGSSQSREKKRSGSTSASSMRLATPYAINPQLNNGQLRPVHGERVSSSSSHRTAGERPKTHRNETQITTPSQLKTLDDACLDYVLRLRDPLSMPMKDVANVAERDQEVAKFNEAVFALRDRIDAKGPQALATHFRKLDPTNSGRVDREYFRKAIVSMNLGPSFTDNTISMLLDSSWGNEDTIDYDHFVDRLRVGTIKYIPANPIFKHRADPDPEKPLGLSEIKNPYGIQSDGNSNTKKWDADMDSMIHSLSGAFQEQDKNNDGKIDFHEFQSAMEAVHKKHNIDVTTEEVMRLFRDADLDWDGAVNYEDFLRSFGGKSGQRFIPEFLKPKSMRCSQNGHPWEWRVSHVCHEA